MVSRETEGGDPSPPSGVGVTSCVGIADTVVGRQVGSRRTPASRHDPRLRRRTQRR